MRSNVGEAMLVAVERAEGMAVDRVAGWAVYRAVYRTMHWDVQETIDTAVNEAAADDPPHPSLPDFLAAAGAEAS